MVESVVVNIHTVLPHHIEFNHTFLENCVLVKILSKDIFISMLIKELCCEACRHEYPYHFVTYCSAVFAEM
jgi:hypothetical protein